MNIRTRTIASFFSVAMAALLLGAVVTSGVQQPGGTLARMTAPAATAEATAPAVALPDPARLTQPFGLDTFKEIARVANPGIVNINTKKVVRRGRGRDPFRDFFGDDLMERFFGPQGRAPESQTQRSLGSGFVVDKEGHILTNRHVIEGADQISVTFGTAGRTYEAKLVGKDARTDVALLKIEPEAPLTVLQLGDSDQTDVGEWVMAIGNPFGLGGNSVTVGVVSYKGRNMPLTPGTGVDMIQTDASINPGNSGGPLLNTAGQVIGINTLIVTQGVPQSAGVGFAVPINVAREILPQLRETGRVVRGWLGVSIQPVTADLARTLPGLSEARGAIVSDVSPGSPAEKGGLEPGDVILGADGQSFRDNNEVSRYIAGRNPGSQVELELLREGAKRSLKITLGTFPDEDAELGGAGEERAQLGMTLQDLTPELAARLQLPRGTRGVVVSDVEAGSAAEDANLQRGDVIVSVNGQAVTGVDEFEAAVDRVRADGLARLRVRRGNGHLFTILRVP